MYLIKEEVTSNESSSSDTSENDADVSEDLPDASSTLAVSTAVGPSSPIFAESGS